MAIILRHSGLCVWDNIITVTMVMLLKKAFIFLHAAFWKKRIEKILLTHPCILVTNSKQCSKTLVFNNSAKMRYFYFCMLLCYSFQRKCVSICYFTLLVILSFQFSTNL
jgi:hypothetical protein